MFAAYLVSVIIVLVNILIAMMSNTFEKIQVYLLFCHRRSQDFRRRGALYCLTQNLMTFLFIVLSIQATLFHYSLSRGVHLQLTP